MGIIRANDPHANDKGYQLKTVLGKMCDLELSTETKRECVTVMTEILQGEHFGADVFRKFGLEVKLETDNAETKLYVRVPKEFVSANISDNRDDQWVVFTVNKATNVSDLKGDVAYITDTNGNPIESEEK